jgi:hypothetical protein
VLQFLSDDGHLRQPHVSEHAMQQPDIGSQGPSPNDKKARPEPAHDTDTTREHGWVDDDYDDFPSEHEVLEQKEPGHSDDDDDDDRRGHTLSDVRGMAHDHVRRLDDGLIWEVSSYTPYETEDPFTYGAERGYAQPLCQHAGDHLRWAGRSGRRDRY